jgi:tetratricopeptide (TPR) repeat protein
MGQVWQAHDLELGEQVAVKVLNPELAADADMLELLRHECRQARRLVHPNIVRIYDFHSADGHAFISMEFVEGGELGQLRDGRPAEILEKVVPLVSALAYAHGQGIVHRDVKPSNVILDREGMPRLVDFGIAALLTSERGLQLSGGGSPLSMSPEQRAGLPPSPADDVFALGVLIYELITGFPPEVEKDGPPPAQMRSRANYAIPARLQALVTRLLAAEAAWRPTDLVQVGSELEAALQESRNLTLPPQVEVVATTDEAEEIVPVSHQPTATARPHRPDAPDRRPLLWVAGAILVMALIGVVFVLPGYVDRERGADTTASTERAARTQAELQQLAAEKAQADEARQRFEALKADLVHRGVDEWGPADFRDVLAMADAAGKAYESAQYETARETLVEASQGLEALGRRATELLEAALQRGAAALEEGRREAAESAFDAALRLDPGNEIATRGLERAGKIDQVFALLAKARRLEEEGEFEGARNTYREVATLDPLVEGTETAVQRLNGKIIDQRYQAAMSRAFAALSAEQYEDAIGAFREAARIRPSASEPGEGIARAQEASRVSRIAAARLRAEAFERDERWKEAVEVYQSILADDPGVAFAQAGARSAAVRASLDARLEGLIADPERIYSDRVQQAARAAVSEAAAIPDPGPRLLRQVSRVETLLAEAARPVRVTLRSDNETEITLYRVGRLGTFEQFELELRPGTYTVTGTRRGYRDVRQQFTIKPGAPAGPFTIRCEEPI